MANSRPENSAATPSAIEKTWVWFWSRIVVLGTVVAVFFALELLDTFVFSQSLNQLGIRPRDTGGLWGILFAPFLHGDLAHAASNTVPFVVLGWFVMLRSRVEFFLVSLITILIGGLGTWLIGGADTVHIGASGLIFGYFGFLLLRGVFERSLLAILLTVVTLVLYGGLIWGVLPGQIGLSWEGHLFGFVGGVLAARMLALRERPQNP